MMRRHFLTTCTIASLLLGAHFAHADELRALRTITVNGLAKNRIIPDEAHVTVNLNASDYQLAKAKDAHDAKLRRLMHLVSDYRIDKRKVSTQMSNVQPMYRYETNPKTGNNEQVFKGYRVQTTVDITVEDTSKLAKLMDDIMKADFDKDAPPEWGQLINMYYTLSDPDKLRDDLLGKAIANAKAKAEKMAAASGAKLSRVFQIQEGGGFNFNPQPVVMMESSSRLDASSPAAMAPPAGEQEIQTSVTVTYELE